jgi:RNA polymerase sigma factor (sigma-70 family)
MSTNHTTDAIETALRTLAPLVTAALTRRHGDFDAAEDAVQEALVEAIRQWPVVGLPENPRGWLTTVAQRRLVDHWRSEASRHHRETGSVPDEETFATNPAELPEEGDDSLLLLFMCCHPAMSPASQVALTLRAVGGLTTTEIAAAYLVPEATMAQRISRAKASIAAAGARFTMPGADDRESRLLAVLQVLYLMFNEGYTASSGEAIHRVDLTREALRLSRLLRRAVPGDGEVSGLLALMLLTDARRGARIDATGRPIPLEEQDRSRWDRGMIDDGLPLVAEALSTGAPGRYTLQAAIAAVHSEAATARDTDWAQILVLYDVLARIDNGPVVALNRAVALGMVHGPQAALAEVDRLASDRRLTQSHRLDAVRARFLELAGDWESARDAWARAARQTGSGPERAWMQARAAAIDPAGARP